MIVRQANENDLHDMIEIQSLCYEPAMRERTEVFDSIIGDRLSFVAVECNAVIGYVLAHRWRALEVPPDLDIPIDTIDCSACCVFLHDLAVKPDYRNLGIANALFEQIEKASKGIALSLVAVNDSKLFWNRYGFKASEYSAKLDSYVDRRAVYMIRQPFF